MGNHPNLRRLATYFVPALLATVALIPTLASAFTVITYVIWKDSFALLIGSGAAFALWLVLAVLCHGLITVKRANVRTYGDFADRLKLLDKTVRESRHDLEPAGGQPGTSEAAGTLKTSQLDEVQAHRDFIGKELSQQDSRWIRGHGYNNLWVALHRAEEALIDGGLAPGVAVVEGLRDELRLLDSQIPLHNRLLLRLRSAVCTLDPSAVRYFLEPFNPPADEKPPEQALSATDQKPPKKETALGVLRDVRHAINNFNDERYDALARTRNTYVDILPIARLAAHLVLAIAILASAPQPQIEAAAVFYLLGVGAGFVFRWYKEVGTEKTIQDFGLATVRQFRPIVLSGVVALMAVMLVSLDQGLNLSTPTATPPPSSTSTAETTAIPAPSAFSVGTAAVLPALRAVAQDEQTSLSSCSDEGTPSLPCIFSLQDNKWGLLVALIFGATPEVLFTLLKAQGEKYIDALKSTSPGESASTA